MRQDLGPHLLAVVSSHGFGHAAQTAPVINALRRQHPALRVTLRTMLPPAFLVRRFDAPYELIAESVDFGMRMRSAIEVDRAASARDYREFHADWNERVRIEAERLRQLAPDLIVANVPYLTLAGAKQAGIPAVALCSLHWADIYAHYLGATAEAGAIAAQMRSAYAAAEVFLQPTPHMPMTDLPNRVPVGPIATCGVDRRAELAERIGLHPGERVVQVSPGGMELRLPAERWPELPNVRFVIPSQWRVQRPDMVAYEDIGMPFPDLLRSSDAFITKPGYGGFAEAAANGVPVLYLRRHDWPEEPYLVEWLKCHGICREVDRIALERGDLAAPLAALWQTAARPPIEPTGIADAATIISALLSR